MEILYRCPKCSCSYPRSGFHNRSVNADRAGKRASYCKKCVALVTIAKMRKFKLDCLEYKGGKCSICSYDRCIAALEFHHLDPTTKEYTFSKFRSQTFGPKVKLELDKCILVCANCHREIHNL